MLVYCIIFKAYFSRLFGLWEKARVGCFERTTSKHVYYLGWNRSPAQAGCIRQVLRPGELGRPRGIGWRGRWEGGSGWGIHVKPWLIHVSVWQNPLKCCDVISLQLIKINEKKKKSGVSKLGNLMLDDVRWNWHNNRNKMHNKCNALESSWNHTSTPSMEKLSSTKPVPDATKVGDHWSKWYSTRMLDTEYFRQYPVF